MSNTYIDKVWPDHQFTLSLDQSLILAMEDEGRWMISKNLTEKHTIPNYLEYVYSDGMKGVKPGSVGIAGAG
jgi:NitT/TauT family transport system substrate-binding protein